MASLQQNAGGGKEMDMRDIQRQGLAIDERLRVPEPQSEDGMERESIRRGVNFSWAVEMLHDHDQVEYKHGLDEDLLRRQESLMHNHNHHNHNGQQQHHYEEDQQQMLGSGGNIQAYNHSDNNGEGKHNFYKWG
jgi:hypothetical protein